MTFCKINGVISYISNIRVTFYLLCLIHIISQIVSGPDGDVQDCAGINLVNKINLLLSNGLIS